MTKCEFEDKIIEFMENYMDNDRTPDIELLEELSDFAKNTEIYQSQKDKADFDDYSYDDVFNHMCLKINYAPAFAVFCAVLCIPFIYDKYIQERGK